MVVKTFRGLLADGGQDRIRLQTIKGKVGYKIVKFQIIGSTPGADTQESLVKIYKTEQSSVTGTVNFTDTDLLACAIWQLREAPGYSLNETVIFDSEIFNQDIYISHNDVGGSEDCNYYLELEVIPLDDAGAEYTTLKDMRQV